MSYVIQYADGSYAKGRGGLTTELQKARVYSRKVDAMNGIYGTDRETVKIIEINIVTASTLKSMEEDADTLARLEAYGVDNWQGYCDAINDTEGVFKDEE